MLVVGEVVVLHTRRTRRLSAGLVVGVLLAAVVCLVVLGLRAIKEAQRLSVLLGVGVQPRRSAPQEAPEARTRLVVPVAVEAAMEEGLKEARQQGYQVVVAVVAGPHGQSHRLSLPG